MKSIAIDKSQKKRHTRHPVNQGVTPYGWHDRKMGLYKTRAGRQNGCHSAGNHGTFNESQDPFKTNSKDKGTCLDPSGTFQDPSKPKRCR